MTKQIYAIVVNRDDTVRVISIDVVKETPQYYITNAWKRRDEFNWNDPRRADLAAFGVSDRTPKKHAFTSARAALEFYMAKRQAHKANAQAVIGQATKQIASANELLMHLPEEPESLNAGATTSAEGATESAQDRSSSSVAGVGGEGR